MEFCLGCGSDLPSSKKDVRNLSFGYSASCSATVEVTSTWKHLMVEVVESQGFSYNRVFTEENDSLKMCKNCFKVFENLSSKLTKLKEKLAVAASKACCSASERHQTISTTPSRRRSMAQTLQNRSDLASPSVQVRQLILLNHKKKCTFYPFRLTFSISLESNTILYQLHIAGT